MIIFTFTLYLSLIMLAVIALFYGFTMKMTTDAISIHDEVKMI